MADFQGQMFRHLRSARQWLVRAEESFNKDSDIRGELNLFLAQAELQHARETNHSRRWRYKYPLLRHTLSAVLAASILAVGLGTYWWLGERNAVVPIPLAAQESVKASVNRAGSEPATDQVRTEAATPVASAPAVAVTAPARPVSQPAERQDKTDHPRQTDKDQLVSPDEMQKIIRAAGKSLRGQ
jgi:hypothetical protein